MTLFFSRLLTVAEQTVVVSQVASLLSPSLPATNTSNPSDLAVSAAYGVPMTVLVSGNGQTTAGVALGQVLSLLFLNPCLFNLVPRSPVQFLVVREVPPYNAPLLAILLPIFLTILVVALVIGLILLLKKCLKAN